MPRRAFPRRLCPLPPLRVLAVAALVLLLAACMPTRREVRRAVEAVEPRQPDALSCARADHCALASPLYARAEALRAAQPPRHLVRLLDYGQDALLARIHLIRSARHSIELQSFIFAEDDSGAFIVQELLAAARRGVRVRVLVDQLFSADDPHRLAELAVAHRNFELRLYNPAFGEAETGRLQFLAGIVCCFTRFNQRMHNKLLVVDGLLGISGGRNVQNRYFDWDPGFNYRDRDVLVAGPVVAAMQASFDAFWNHRLSVPVAALRDVRRILRREPSLPLAPARIRRGDRMLDLSAQADSAPRIRRLLLDPALETGPVEFWSDLPNKPLERNSREERALTESLLHLLDETRGQLLMQTPYLVFSKEAQRQFRRLHQRPQPPRVIVSTNSLAATDAFPVYALSHKYKRRYLREFGFRIHELKPFPAWVPVEVGAGKPLDEAVLGAYATESRRAFGSAGSLSRRGPLPLRQAGMRVGLHAKSMVIDERIALIGTHNFDPRSDWINTESFVLIRDPAVARELSRSILRDTRPENAWTIARRPRPALFSGLNYTLGKWSEKLPIFDLWPWGYATSWEIRPGCAPLDRSDPGFEDCYVPVGDFPEVETGGKSLSTRILTAFGAGLAPIL